jgi:exonuclease VII small subunit
MPEPLVKCPSCGHEVPVGKFCKICGESLPSMEMDESSTEVTSSNEEIAETDVQPIETPPPALPHFDIAIDDMDHDSSAILLSQAELEVIDDELKRIIEQTRATRQALQLQQADKSLLTLRAETLRDEFERLKQRKHELASVKQKLVLQQLLEALDTYESKLTKLEEISGTLDKEVYREQREEILGNLKNLRSNLKSSIKTAKKWSKGINSSLKTIQKERSRLDAKFKIGDISRQKYEESITRLERAVRVIEGGQQRLDELLGTAMKR